VIKLQTETLDVKRQMCPLPVALTKRKLEKMAKGQMLEVVGEGELELDNILKWVKNNGHEVVEKEKDHSEFKLIIKKHS
jgi:tRNA 2-thiouridine synthesizing protein A